MWLNEMRTLGRSKVFIFLFLVFIKWMRGGGVGGRGKGWWVQDFLPLSYFASKMDLVWSVCRWLSQWCLFLFYWMLMLLLVTAMGFENSGTVLKKWNVVSRLYGFCSWCYSSKWEHGVSPRFYLVVLLVGIKGITWQGESEIPLCSPCGEKLLLKLSSSCNNILESRVYI